MTTVNNIIGAFSTTTVSDHWTDWSNTTADDSVFVLPGQTWAQWHGDDLKEPTKEPKKDEPMYNDKPMRLF